MYEMKDEFLTGIQFIDEEHTKLFEITNRLYEISRDEFIPDKYDYIVDIIKELTEYTKYHFNHEEEFMKSINYRRILSQMVYHKEFVDRLEAIDLDSVDIAQEKTMTELLNFLYDWLVNHICNTDKLIAKDLKERGLN